MKDFLDGLGKSLVLGLFLALVFQGGCNDAPPPSSPTTIINNNTNTNNNGGGLSDPNAVATQCLPSEEVPIRVDLTLPDGPLTRAGAPIDATPKSASGKRSDGCNVLQGIAWSVNPPTVAHVKEPSTFNTMLFCDGPGTIQLTATVPGHGASGTATLVCS